MGDIIHPSHPPRPMGVLHQRHFDGKDDDHHNNEDQANKDNFLSSQCVHIFNEDYKVGGISMGTNVLGTQLPLYDTIVTPLHCEVASHKVTDSNLPGIDPNQE